MDAISNNNIEDCVRRFDCKVAAESVLASMTVAHTMLTVRLPSTKRGAWIRVREMLEMDIGQLQELLDMVKDQEEDAG
jgi:hypothetical protein